MRAVSKDAGLGAGYLHGVLREGKEPGVDHLILICDQLGVSFAYVLLGFEVTPETLRLVEVIEREPERRDAVLRLLPPLRRDEPQQE
jgi:hypothetical protein